MWQGLGTEMNWQYGKGGPYDTLWEIILKLALLVRELRKFKTFLETSFSHGFFNKPTIYSFLFSSF